jgi:hypothetical protein
MTIFLTITGLTYAIGLFLFFKKIQSDKLDKLARLFHFTFLGLTVLTLILLFNDYRIKGQYTNSIIGQLFICSSILLFSLTKSKGLRIYSGLLTIPQLICGLIAAFGQTAFLLPFMVAYTMFSPPLTKSSIDKTYNVETHQGGFMACSEHIYVTKTAFAILDRQIFIGNPSCVRHITKIEVTEFLEKKKFIYKAYHDSEEYWPNPYIDTVDLGQNAP